MLRRTCWTLFAVALVVAASTGVQAFVPGGNAASTNEGSYRKLAPGVLTVVPSDVREGERTSVHDIVEVLAVDPEYGKRAPEDKSLAKDIRFAHDAWSLEFAYKPVRFIRVNLPAKDGGLESKLVWYMIYRVRNVIDPKDTKNPEGRPIRFIPRFWLEDLETKKVYQDKLLPAAIAAIQQREDPNRKLLNAVEIAGQEIPPCAASEDKGVWGVVTWDDIDTHMDKFAIYASGLSSAYLWEDDPAAYKAGDPPGTGRKLTTKTLRLNFWRPGDSFFEHESEIRSGSSTEGEVDYRWFYR